MKKNVCKRKPLNSIYRKSQNSASNYDFDASDPNTGCKMSSFKCLIY